MPDLLGFISKFGRGVRLLRRERPLRAGLDRGGEPVPLLHAGRHELALHRRRRAVHDRASWRRSRRASSSTTSRSGPSPAVPGGATQPIARLEPVHRRRQPAHRRPGPESEVRHLRRAPGTMRRVVAITRRSWPLASLVVFGQAASGSRRQLRGPGDLRQRQLPGPRRGGAGRRRRRRERRLGGRDDAGRVGEPRADQSSADDPGKAVVVMKITDAGFQDFRQDASCLIRPQSLLGEKYVDCEPTQPRAPGSQPPPPLDRDPGRPAGRRPALPAAREQRPGGRPRPGQQHHAPALRRPLPADPQRARRRAWRPAASTLDAIIKRADPALRQTDRVLAVLAAQNHQLARLAQDSDTILTPLARERTHLAGFINNANTAAQATAERSADLESGLQKFPAALHELRLTMAKLRGFSEQATPVFSEFRTGAPAIARATEALGPFAHAATPALTTLGHGRRSRASSRSSTPTRSCARSRTWPRRPAPGAKSLDHAARQPAQDRRLQVPDQASSSTRPAASTATTSTATSFAPS